MLPFIGGLLGLATSGDLAGAFIASIPYYLLFTYSTLLGLGASVLGAQ